MDEEQLRQEIEQQLASSAYYEKEAAKVLTEYRSCPTMYGQARMLPRLDAMLGKMRFQQRELEKYMTNDENL